MKKLLVILTVLALVLIVYFRFFAKPAVAPAIPPPASPQASSPLVLDQMPTIQFQDQTYHYAYVVIDDLSRLKLLPNHDSRISSEAIIQANHCQILVNAGFYDQTDQPLGWLVSQGKTLSKPIPSSLFNGFLSLAAGQAGISAVMPETKVDFGLQSGPLLILNQKPLLLKIQNDQPRRRVVAALTGSNQLIFLVLAGSDSTYSGPMLADTPALVAKLGKTINQSFVSSLNLDGGSASAFYTGSLYLKEYSYVGSFFCYN